MSKRSMNAQRAFLQSEAVGRSPVSVGANATRQALADTDWSQQEWVRRHGKWSLYVDEALDFMAVFVDDISKAIAVHPDTWQTLAYEETAIALLFRDMTKGGSGMKFIVANAGPYALAARKRAEAEGTDITTSKDSIEQITQRAQALVEQAASLNRAPSALQMQVFAQKYAALEADLSALQARVGEIRSLVTLAGTAVFDSTQ